MSEIKILLNGHELRWTPGREAMVTALQGCAEPVSAESLFALVRELTGGVSLSTVYRFLEQLEEKKLVSRVLLGDSGFARYEWLHGHDHHRHHVTCVDCRRVTVVDTCPLAIFEKHVATQTDYEITGHRLELFGVCPECRTDRDSRR